MACRSPETTLPLSKAFSILFLRPLQSEIQCLIKRPQVPGTTSFPWSPWGGTGTEPLWTEKLGNYSRVADPV